MRNIIIVSNHFHTFQKLYDVLKNAGYSHIHHAIDSGDLSHMLYRLQPRLVVVDAGIPSEELRKLVRLLNNPISKITLFLLPDGNDGALAKGLFGRCFTNFITCPMDDRFFVQLVSQIIDIEQHNA